MDQRDQLALDMANLSGATVSVDTGGRYDVSINGVSLVQGDTAGSLQVATGIDPATGGSDGSPLAFQVTGPDGSVSRLGASMSGELGGIMVLQNVTLPTYKSGLDGVASQLANAVNTVQLAGYDLDGNPAGTANGAAADSPFFTFDPSDPSGSLKVAITDSSKLAASSSSGQVFDGANADDMATAADVSGSYQTLVSQMGAIVDGVNSQTTNQQALTTQVDDEQQQLTGVSLDEETINLMAAQHAYEASSRVMSTLDSILDTLINRTGV
jgi:flagellar hook-associated protein 1